MPSSHDDDRVQHTLNRIASAFASRDLDRIRRLVHPECEVQLLAANREILVGAEAIADALADTTGTAYHIVIDSVEPERDRFAIIHGSARLSASPQGHSIGTYVWVWEIRDGLLLRSRVFDTDEEAYAYIDAQAALPPQ